VSRGLLSALNCKEIFELWYAKIRAESKTSGTKTGAPRVSAKNHA
jgi:hypothetical protein